MLAKLRDRIFKQRNAYRDTFNGPAGKQVLADLAQFCRARQTPAVVSPVTQTIDPIATGVAIGRLEVWHRIVQNIHLSDADLMRLVEETQGDE